MITKLLLHPRTFLISKNGIIPAFLANDIEVLGKDDQDEYVYKKIQRIGETEGKTIEILTEKRLFHIYDGYHVYTTKGRPNASQIIEDDKIFNFRDVQSAETIDLLKSPTNYPNSYKSYLCGFQNSLLAKFFHDEEYTPTLDDAHYHDNLFFLELENKKLLDISENLDDNSLLKKIILWHKEREITDNFSKIYEKIHKNMSYSSSGIIIRCIPEKLARDLHPLNAKQSNYDIITPLLPLYVTEFSNIQFFLVGFLTGMVWDGRRVDYDYATTKSLSWSHAKKVNTNRKMITTEPITLYMKKAYFLPKILSYFLSFYDIKYEYEYRKKTGEIKMYIHLTNIPNLLENKLGNTGYRNSSQVLHKMHHDKSDLINFNVNEPKKLWKPILDFTLVEID